MAARDNASSHRVATSDHLEVSTYLEIARKESGASDPESSPIGVGEGVVIVDFGSQYSRLIARGSANSKSTAR